MAGTPGWVEPLRAKLGAAVKARKLTQKQLADAAGITQSAVSQFLDHTTNQPTGNLLVEGCRLLNISVDTLTGLDTHEGDPVSTSAPLEESRAFLGRLATALIDVLAHPDTREQTAAPRKQSPRRPTSDRTHR